MGLTLSGRFFKDWHSLDSKEVLLQAKAIPHGLDTDAVEHKQKNLTFLLQPGATYSPIANDVFKTKALPLQGLATCIFMMVLLFHTEGEKQVKKTQALIPLPFNGTCFFIFWLPRV